MAKFETNGKRKRRTREERDESEAKQLEEELFGIEDAHEIQDVERKGTGTAQGGGGASEGGPKRTPKWEDPDEEELRMDLKDGPSRNRKLRNDPEEADVSGKEYVERLRRQHQNIHATAVSWAQLPTPGEEVEEDVAGRILRSAKDVLAKPKFLPQGCIEATRMRDANLEEPNKAVVQSLEFHPSGGVLMTAGLDRKLRFFQVDGVRNKKLESLHFDDLPIHKAAFNEDGSQVVLTGRRKFFYIYDVASAQVDYVAGIQGREEKSLENFVISRGGGEPTVAFLGNKGYLPLVSLKTKQWMGNLKMSGTVKAAAFVPGKPELFTSGVDGMVYTWDLRMRRCIGKAVDEGSYRCTSLACSSDGMVATGSESGIVNLYSKNKGTLDLQKTIYNLTTRCDTMVFNPDNQILALASSRKKDALKLLHLPSNTVFSNWPTSKTPLSFVHSVAFSPGSGFFAIGNARGAALLYRLHHFETT